MMREDKGEALWTAQDVANYLRVSLSMVYKLAGTGELPRLHIGACVRFAPEIVRRFARGEVRGEPEGRIVEIRKRVA
jgi:excisionase family DNA binding protein